MIRVLAPLLAVLALVAPAFAQQPAPMIKPEGLAKVSEHVWIIPDQSVGGVPNVGIVLGSRAALVIDTGLGPRNGEIVLEAARKVAGSRKLYLAVTHVHPEHDLGAQAFPADTVMIRSEDQVKDIAEFGLTVAKNFSARSPAMAVLLEGAEFRKANVTFASDYALDLGGVTVRFFALGANHTRGDTAFWVEGDKVLFSGDVAMKGPPGLSSTYSSIAHWLVSLDRLEALKPTLIVPSHGPTGGVELITGYRTYFTVIRERTAAAKAKGETVDQAAASVATELKDRWPENRVQGVAKAAYAEFR